MLPIFTPIGANKIVSGIISIKAGRFTRPHVPSGASVGVVPILNKVITPGNAINKPNTAAVPRKYQRGMPGAEPSMHGRL